MGDVSLDMIWKRLEDFQTGQDAMRSDIAAVRSEIAAVNESVRSLARSVVTIQRDISALKDRVTVLAVAVDEHPTAHA
jgi:cell division septum initiation protein DivIVA